MNEVWRDIIGYEGYYQVSNLGNVKSLGNDFSRKERLLKLSLQGKGYFGVVLQKYGVRKPTLVHRLVAIHFISNNDNKPQVNHINGVKTDNRVENLEWVTHRENLDHAINNDLTLKGQCNPTSKLKETEVLEIYNFLKIGVKVEYLQTKYNISKDVIIGIKSGIYWKHLNLKPFKGRASLVTLKTILTIEDLIKKGLNNNQIYTTTKCSTHLINRIRFGEYNTLKNTYLTYFNDEKYI